mgnify:CR=1 FL=1
MGGAAASPAEELLQELQELLQELQELLQELLLQELLPRSLPVCSSSARSLPVLNARRLSEKWQNRQNGRAPFVMLRQLGPLKHAKGPNP